jgi:hypothetical protein
MALLYAQEIPWRVAELPLTEFTSRKSLDGLWVLALLWFPWCSEG